MIQSPTLALVCLDPEIQIQPTEIISFISLLSTTLILSTKTIYAYRYCLHLQDFTILLFSSTKFYFSRKFFPSKINVENNFIGHSKNIFIKGPSILPQTALNNSLQSRLFRFFISNFSFCCVYNHTLLYHNHH